MLSAWELSRPRTCSRGLLGVLKSALVAQVYMAPFREPPLVSSSVRSEALCTRRRPHWLPIKGLGKSLSEPFSKHTTFTGFPTAPCVASLILARSHVIVVDGAAVCEPGGVSATVALKTLSIQDKQFSFQRRRVYVALEHKLYIWSAPLIVLIRDKGRPCDTVEKVFPLVRCWNVRFYFGVLL